MTLSIEEDPEHFSALGLGVVVVAVDARGAAGFFAPPTTVAAVRTMQSNDRLGPCKAAVAMGIACAQRFGLWKQASLRTQRL